MKVTITEKQYYDRFDLKQSIERVCHVSSMKELEVLPIGLRAEKIKLEVEFDENDIPSIIKFLENCAPCFLKK